MLGLHSTVYLVLELAVVHKGAHNLQDELELVLVLPASLVRIMVRLSAALQEASEYLTAPLFRAVPFRVETEPEEDRQTFHLGRIGKVR